MRAKLKNKTKVTVNQIGGLTFVLLTVKLKKAYTPENREARLLAHRQFLEREGDL
jgi:hypothetical protein